MSCAFPFATRCHPRAGKPASASAYDSRNLTALEMGGGECADHDPRHVRDGGGSL